MRQLSTVLLWQIRNIRANRPPPGTQKIKFTEEEITQMGQYRHQPSARNIANILHEKVQEKVREKGENEEKENGRQGDKRQGKQSKFEEEEAKSVRMEKKVKASREKFRTFKIYKHIDMLAEQEKKKKKQAELGSLITNEQKLDELARVRLREQYLPYEYMKQVQKVLQKYDQTQLRDASFHFSNLMRLRYNEQKIDYDAYPNLKFNKLEEQLPHHRQVQQIYLTGKHQATSPQSQAQNSKIDSDPIEPQIKYSQNLAVSYLLNRSPRTYAVAARVISELRKMFPKFQPKSFLDFGAGLSSGAAACVDAFGNNISVFSVEPGSKMRKLGKYLTSYSQIKHCESLAELAGEGQMDIVYCGYVLNELKPELITVYLEAMLAKVKPGGFLAVVEYGNPFGARLIHQARKWSLTKQIRIAAPCAHMNKCPLANSNHWCHFDQPAGALPREVFGKLPGDQAIQLEKYSYILLQKLQGCEDPVEPNEQQEWDRILFPLMRKGGHYIYTVCGRSGRFEKRIAARSHGVEYKSGRKLHWGDFWRYGQRIPNRYRKERRTGKRLW